MKAGDLICFEDSDGGVLLFQFSHQEYDGVVEAIRGSVFEIIKRHPDKEEELLLQSVWYRFGPEYMYEKVEPNSYYRDLYNKYRAV